MYKKLEKNANYYLSLLVVFLIKVIKMVFLMPEGTCKYVPSCSQYAKEVIRKYNVIVAFFKITIRVLKCNPFSKGGIDPA